MAKGIFKDRLRYERMSPDKRAKLDKAKELLGRRLGR